MEEKQIGHISNYFSKLSVAVVEMTSGTLSVGDTLRIKGHTTDFELKVSSMQIEHEMVTEAKKGDGIGLKVSEKVRKGDKVYRVIED